MTFQVSVPLSTLPLTLVCRGDGKIALQPSQNFKYFTDGVASFDMAGFTIRDESQIDDIQYNYGEYLDYKNIPNVLQFLQSLNMEMPSFQQSGFQHSPFQGFGFQ